MNLFHESTGCACLAEGAKQFSHKLQATVSELTGRKLRNVIVKVIREEYQDDFR